MQQAVSPKLSPTCKQTFAIGFFCLDKLSKKFPRPGRLAVLNLPTEYHQRSKSRRTKGSSACVTNMVKLVEGPDNQQKVLLQSSEVIF